MSQQEFDSLADEYLRAAGESYGKGYRLSAGELAWLVEHATRMSEARLHLLRALQAELPREGGEAAVAETKELLTNLIIMQSRLQERDARLGELLRQLVASGSVSQISVDDERLRGALSAIIEAYRHLLDRTGNAQ